MKNTKLSISIGIYIALMLCFAVYLNSAEDHSPATMEIHDTAGIESDDTAHNEKATADKEVSHGEAVAGGEKIDAHKGKENHGEASLNTGADPNPESVSDKEEASRATASHETACSANPFAGKPTPDDAINMLKEGNLRFVGGTSKHPHLNVERLTQAGSENQGDHAYATVITCSDSRVPVEAIFDAGIMDIFVIRVAGNVCDVDERGSIEYGLAHVHTPVLVVLGHTQCGAVTAVTHAVLGQGHALERNIPPLVDNILPAVKKAIADNPDVKGTDIIPMAIEQNIWTGIEELFLESPSTREFVKRGYAKVVGAIYDVGHGTIEWLPEEKTMEILKKVEENPDKATFETQKEKTPEHS